MRFKDLRKSLIENGGYGAETGFSHLRPAVGPFNPDGAIDTPETNIASLTGEAIEKINAYLGAAFCKSYINPSTVLNQIKMKLGEFGLHFDYRLPPSKQGVGPTKTTNSTLDKNGPIDHVEEGEHYYPLTMYGGSYGRYPTDPGYEPYHSDGITRKTGTPLVLCVHVMRNENSTFTVKPYIKMGSVQNPAMEQTEVDGEDIVEVQTPLRSKEMKMKYNDAWLQGDKEARQVKKQDDSEKADKKFLYLKGGKKVRNSGQNPAREEVEASDEDLLNEVVSMQDLGFKPTTSIGGTSLIGYIKGTTINEITKILGQPKRYTRGEKVSVLWAIGNGRLTITIYDYTTGGLDDNEKYDFHVGTFYNKYSVTESVRRALRLMGLKFTAKKR